MQSVLSLSVLLIALAGVSLALECPNCGAAKCPPKWTEFQGVCYKLLKNETAFSFTDAQRQCQSMGSSLASIPSAQVNSFLTEFSASSSDANCSTPMNPLKVPSCAVWVGFARVETAVNFAHDSRFFWLDGTDFKYQHWAQGQPAGPAQHCGNLWSGATGNLNGFWDNFGCNTTPQLVRRAICAQCPSKCLKC
ncbi:lectin c-type domain-containing protein [Ditylenchus destructor]|nr:lectin c-type domain-containing protein [Ditylenchus destructor]